MAGRGALKLSGEGVFSLEADAANKGEPGVVWNVEEVLLPPEERSPLQTSASEECREEEWGLVWLELRLSGSPSDEYGVSGSGSGMGMSASASMPASISIAQSSGTEEESGDTASCLHLFTLS